MKIPSHLQDYHYSLPSSKATNLIFPSTNHWCNLVKLGSAQIGLLTSSTIPTELQSYQEAAAHSDWVTAMEKEL